jgi:PHP family Zn ribbon phosphoesterase
VKNPLAKAINKMRERTCPHCSNEYTLGVNGVDSGCDECEGIVRNPVDNSIINFGDITEETFQRTTS